MEYRELEVGASVSEGHYRWKAPQRKYSI